MFTLFFPQGDEEIISAMRFLFERMKVSAQKEKVCFNDDFVFSSYVSWYCPKSMSNYNNN